MKLQNTLTFTCLGGGGGVTLRAQVLVLEPEQKATISQMTSSGP